ncbi:hypothetical protein [Flavobacterium mesophilum]|uniref:hypothetical protein n=1 Tax=Flavobacterium mesophilum TaxID=3143495 RepID=UPI0031DC0F06
MIEVLLPRNKNPQIMLEKFLKSEGTKKLTKEEQKNIAGGTDPEVGMCWTIDRGYFKCP